MEEIMLANLIELKNVLKAYYENVICNKSYFSENQKAYSMGILNSIKVQIIKLLSPEQKKCKLRF
ncbi:hypothetical protein [Fusobacterium hominis]|uniref:hypothetical protein n=1 Tax=Fusobacterium hominis TaxID=2764326 RepID=UPI0022E4A36A|nr:hypothetical protein [Fusobacterium hominis]